MAATRWAAHSPPLHSIPADLGDIGPAVPASAFARLSGSLVADLNLEELLRDGSDFLLPEDFQDELLAFESATPAAYTAVSAQPISDTFISRGSSQDVSSGCETIHASNSSPRAAMLGGSSSPLDRLPPIYQVSPSSASTGQPYIKHEYGDSARGEVFIEEAERSRRMSQRTSKPKHEDLSHSVVQDANGQYRHLTEKEIKRMRRRITNRESAQRMRRKRQEDFQNVVQSLSGMQAENAKLKQVQLGMVELLQRMKREVVQWQVRAQGAQRQNTMLMQQLLDRQAQAQAEAPADAAATVTTSVPIARQPSGPYGGAPPPTRSASPFPGAPHPLHIPQGEGYTPEPGTDGMYSPMSLFNMTHADFMGSPSAANAPPILDCLPLLPQSFAQSQAQVQAGLDSLQALQQSFKDDDLLGIDALEDPAGDDMDPLGPL